MALKRRIHMELTRFEQCRVNCVSPWYIGTPLALQVTMDCLVRVCACMYVCMYACVADIHAVCICCIHTYFVCMYVCMGCLCMHVWYMYAYEHSYTHTYATTTHTQTGAQGRNFQSNRTEQNTSCTCRRCLVSVACMYSP